MRPSVPGESARVARGMCQDRCLSQRTDVDAVRAFNRFYTNRIGALRSGLLHTRHPLPQARVLYELAQREVTEVADLRRTLDLDAGYLSRLLAKLDDDGLLTRERSTDDGRRQRLRLTARGRGEFAELDRRSRDEVGGLLGDLDEPQRERLVQAMGDIHAVLEPLPSPPPFHLRGPEAGDLGWIVERHGALYEAEYGWDQSFEALVAGVVAAYDSETDGAWIAEAGGRRAGCVLCVRKDETTAQLRLLLVEPWARGAGLGARLIEACLAFAEDRGHREITLWTNDVLHDARRLYERAGFTL